MKTNYASLNKSIHLFTACELVIMAAKEVISALHVLTSHGHLCCKTWLDNSALEVLIMDYFAGSDKTFDESEASNSDYNGNSMHVVITP